MEESERISRRKATRKWVEKNKEHVKAYQKDWYRRTKALKRNGAVDKTKEEKEMMIKQAEIFIERIERQGGWCDEIDGFILTGIYSELFGSTFYRKYPDDMESELSYMYLTIKRNLDNIKKKLNSTGDLFDKKQCSTCKKIKDITEFHVDKKNKDGRSGKCKPCKMKYQKEYFKKNPDKAALYQSRYNKSRKK